MEQSMTRIVIFETRGRFAFRLQQRRWWLWRTTSTSPTFRTLPLLLASLSSIYARATEAKTGIRDSRQTRRAAARAIAKVAH